MSKGISIFIGMKYSLKENLDYMRKAGKLGFENIFTSLHIPEANYEKAIEEFYEIANLAYELDMKIIADISPRAFTYLKADMNNLQKIAALKIYGIRVDFGFSPFQIAEFTRNPYGLKVEINASTVTEKFLRELEEFKPNYKMLQACHNYYPRLNTGISEQILLKKNQLLKKYDVEISAFIPSLSEKRGPIFEGLPTLEKHRALNPKIAAMHLFSLGLDSVIFGDSMASNEELKEVGNITEEIIELDIELFTKDDLEKSIVLKKEHINRPDCAADVIRSTLSREELGSEDVIVPNNNIERRKGYITIDNKDYLRYAGELQICKRDLPLDNRVNVVGKVVDEEIFLLDYIKEETKYKFNCNSDEVVKPKQK